MKKQIVKSANTQDKIFMMELMIPNNFKTHMYVKNLISKKKSSAQLCNYILGWACKEGCIGTVKLVLGDCRTDPSYDDNYPLRMASHHKHMNIVKLLLQDERTTIKLDDIGIMLFWHQ